MQSMLANKSLFTLLIPSLRRTSLRLLKLDLRENLSSFDCINVKLSGPDSLSPKDFLDQPFHLSWDSEGVEQHYHGIITGVMIQPITTSETIYQLTCRSPLSGLKKSCRSRHFIYKNLKTLIKEVLKEANTPLLDIVFHLKGEDPDRDFTGQHDESDHSFIERILHEVSWFYGLIHSENGVVLHVRDNHQDAPVFPRPVRFQPLVQGTKTTESIFEINHESSAQELMSAKSDCMGLRAGSVFSLTGHPVQSLNQQYLVVSVTHEVDEQANALRYQNSLHLIPANQVFTPIYSEPEEAIHTLGLARIHSDSDTPLLTEKGEYILRSPHTDELTHPVRLATPYAGPDYGFHFPLHQDTQVLVAYLNGHPDKPVVLGSLFNDEQSNVVTNINPRQNRWITQSGHTFLLDDQPGAQKIVLHTPEQLHRLSLDATDGVEKIELISETGEFQANISQGSEFTTQDHHFLSAGQSIQMTAVDDCFFSSDEANMQCEAAQDLTHQAGQDLSLHAEQNLTIRVDGESQIHVKSSMRTDIEMGDYLLKLSAGSLTHEAQKNIQFSTSSGDLVLKTAQASVTFKADGNIVFQGKNIVLDAKTIDVHNAGKGVCA